MKFNKKSLLLIGLLLLFACKKEPSFDARWSQPVAFSKSYQALAHAFTVHKWKDSLIGLRVEIVDEQTRTLHCHFLLSDGETWKEQKFPGHGRSSPLLVDPAKGTIVFYHEEDSPEKVIFNLECITVNEEGALSVISAPKIDFKKTDFYEKIPPQIIGFHVVPGMGDMSGLDYLIPYCASGPLYQYYGKEGKQLLIDDKGGPASLGLLLSKDQGSTWTKNPITNFNTQGLGTIATTQSIFLFGYKTPKILWITKRNLKNQNWSVPSTLISSVSRYGGGVYGGGFYVHAEADTIHLCWLDDRNEKHNYLRSLKMQSPERGNYQVYYRNCSGGDEAWGNEILLSNDLQYAFAPVLAAEGNKVVVAWSGAQSGKSDHSILSPNDIYFAISADGGKTWKPPMRATDVAKNGFAASEPRVALHQGIIHLWYAQGKLDENQITPGLKLLNQPPWDIMYQHRDFPQ